ncbi:hypothetical protein [Streptomyces sp. NBC_01727]
MSRVEENAAADSVQLAPAHLERLTNLPPAVGTTHTEAQMKMLER